ncbi:YqiJ family protein [Alterisphingorhabdus coralli]|uniref:YqiJ family protein n=1 Tax=Alterisphingorhabdus coralli TaxID=3071408 RepID=A0AA97F9E8_9SPHN|nr:YqiJ family protein [Parasphingorhabdus sp. SCSIO 66989]WOE74905.1 YqiJ family protein [Parasphingorhabdus sp. SCSIO 66989]
MSAFWFASENLFFTGSLFVMLLLGMFQAIGLGDLFGDADFEVADIDVADFDGEIGGFSDGLLGLLGLGKVPLMILLIVLLTIFGLVGLVGQMLIESLTGSYLTPWLAIPATAAIALPLTGATVRPLAKILPRDETTAISRDALIGRFATIEIGKAETGSPARARVIDMHGQKHLVMVEPDNAGQVLEQGEEILLVRREKTLFRAISRGGKKLPSLES